MVREGKQAALTGLFFLIGFLVLVVPHGYHPSDDGYILSMAYRVFSGQVPYRDFITVRPPLPPLLHSIWFYLPENWIFIVARSSFFVFMMLPFFLLLREIFQKAKSLTPFERHIIWTVGLCGLALAIHNFPPMPWHTVDGLFFGSLCLVFAYRSQNGITPNRLLDFFFSGFFAGISILAKQGFIFMPFAFGAYLLFQAMRKQVSHKSWLIFLAGCLVVPTLVLAWLGAHGALIDMKAQLASGSQGGKFFYAAIEQYFRSDILWAIAIGLTPLAFLFKKLEHHFKFYLARIFPFILAIVCSYGMIRLKRHGGFGYGFMALALEAVFVLSLFVVLRHKKVSFQNVTALILSLILAWSTQISWGYITPLLGLGISTLLLISFTIETSTRINGNLPEAEKWMAPAFFALTLLGYVGNLKYYFIYSYRDSVAWEQSEHLNQVFTRTGPVMTGHENFNKLKKLSDLIDTVRAKAPDRDVIVMPDYSLIYFFKNLKNPTPVDWWIGVEYGAFKESVKEKLLAKNLIAIIEGKSGECYSGTDLKEIPDWIVLTGTKISQSDEFCAYEVPKQ